MVHDALEDFQKLSFVVYTFFLQLSLFLQYSHYLALGTRRHLVRIVSFPRISLSISTCDRAEIFIILNPRLSFCVLETVFDGLALDFPNTRGCPAASSEACSET